MAQLFPFSERGTRNDSNVNSDRRRKLRNAGNEEKKTEGENEKRNIEKSKNQQKTP